MSVQKMLSLATRRRLLVGVVSVGLSVVCGGLWRGAAGVLASLDELSVTQGVMVARLADMKDRLDGIYTRTEAVRELDKVWSTDKDQYGRIVEIEKALARAN